MDSKDLCIQVKTQFENANSFKNSIELNKDITRSVLFENGKQWNMDEDIAEYPKITLNIIKQIGKVRKSNVMQNEYAYLVNSTNFKSIRKIQDFLKHLAETVNMRQKDLKSISDDFVKGTAIGYFYWDAEKRGFMRKSGGEMRYEVVDIRNFAVANPYIQSIQDQEWVIFVSREKVNSLEKKYNTKPDGSKKGLNIVPDGTHYTGDTEKLPIAIDISEEYVTVYTKFYRNEEGEVFFVICTENELLKSETPLNPFYKKETKNIDSKEQPNTTSLPDVKETRKDKRERHVWNLYPFARLCLNERDNCFYGMPFAIEVIDSQKSINNHFSVYDKAIQDNVLGGYVYREGVLDENELVAGNGNMIGLKTLPNEPIGNALGRLPAANVPQDSFQYSSALIQTARTIAGASNVQLGSADYSGQSGKQTQMLLERAKENASDTAMMFNEFKKEQAYIMFLFAKFFYDNENFTIVEHGFQKDTVRNYSGEDKFDGTEYLDDDVLINIKVGAAPAFSEYSNIEILGLMVQSGQAPFEAYVALLPDGYISNKQELIDIAEKNSLKQIQALQQQIEQMQKIMEQMAKAYESTRKDRSNIDTIIKENENLKSMLAEISAKAINRVSESTSQNQELTEEMRNILNILNKSGKIA